MNSAAAQQTCNHCDQTDFTDFSTCRFCGKKYGTMPPASQKSYLTEKALAVCVAVIVMIAVVHHERSKASAARASSIASIVREINAVHRPRVLEFYADWCGPCRGYGPTIEAARAKYSGIDFVRYNVDERASSEICRGLGVTAIPVTVFFDSSGKLIDQEVGALPYEMLDEQLKKLN